jgi:polygalacturonase
MPSATARVIIEESSFSSSDDLETVKASRTRKNHKKPTE